LEKDAANHALHRGWLIFRAIAPIWKMLTSPATEFDAREGYFSISRFTALPARCRREPRFRERKHPMPVGTVKFFNNDKGFGFIAPDDGGKDSFVHISAVERAGMSTLEQNQRLSYEVEADQRGRESAVNLEAA
jgi:CspA family cold shock protein